MPTWFPNKFPNFVTKERQDQYSLLIIIYKIIDFTIFSTAAAATDAALAITTTHIPSALSTVSISNCYTQNYN